MQKQWNEQFEKKIFQECNCWHLDLNLKAILARYIRAFNEFKKNRNDFEKDELTWRLLQGLSGNFFNQNKNKIINIFAKMRNYNAHFFYNENVFSREDNIIKLFIKGSFEKSQLTQVIGFFDDLLKQTENLDNFSCKGGCSNSELKMAKWSFMLFASSVLLYQPEYSKLKNNILNFLNGKIQKGKESSYFSQCLKAFKDNVDFFENTINIKILQKSNAFEENEVFILNQMQEIIHHSQKILKDFQPNNVTNIDLKTELSLNKMVQILNVILDFDQKKDNYQIRAKIRSNLYCDGCKNLNNCILLTLTEKQDKRFKQSNCIKCKRYFSQKTQDMSWYLEKPTYQISKNIWSFEIVFQKNNKTETKTALISKKTLQKFLLWISWYTFKKNTMNQKEYLAFFQKKFDNFFQKIINDKTTLNSEQKFIEHILSPKSITANDLQTIVKETGCLNFCNRGYIKKYKYLQNKNHFVPFTFEEQYQILTFFKNRKQHQVNKLKVFLQNLQIKQNDKKNLIYFGFVQLFNDFSNKDLDISEILRIRLKFILQVLNSAFLDKKLKTKHFNHIFSDFFKQVHTDPKKINLLTILHTIKFASPQEKSNFDLQIKKIQKEIGLFQYQDLDKNYQKLFEYKIQLLEKEINTDCKATSNKDIRNFYFSILKLNAQHQKTNQEIKINNQWLSTVYSDEPNLTQVVNDNDINAFLSKHLNYFLQIINKITINEILTTKQKFLDYLADKKKFINKCEIILRYYFHELFKQYFLSLKDDKRLFIFKEDQENFINSKIAYKIQNKRNLNQYFDIIFNKIGDVKINYFQIYNLNSWLKISEFINSNPILKTKMMNKETSLYFSDLIQYVDKVHIDYGEDKTLTFRAWKIITCIFMEEKKKYEQFDLQTKQKLIDKFNKKSYLGFEDLFSKDKHLISLRNHCLHLNPLSKEDGETFKAKFPVKFQKLVDKQK